MKKWPTLDLMKSNRYNGVYYDSEKPEPKRWVARVNRSCARFNLLGSFETESEAAKAYNNYIKRHNLDVPLNDLKSQDE
ncbi:MAG: hypothetical protein SWO11_16790 [Thermodesulfobacteriota bacterium]|nr:hypothetical protein [Thermodesulfobacteriota bacterium]